MVAYSFQSRFVPKIEDGTKRGTIRGERKRHARIGEPIQLYQGMRTKYCRKIIPDPVCVSVMPIRLHIEAHAVAIVNTQFALGIQARLSPASFDLFAQDDGFDDMADMHAFWMKTHGVGVFRGVWIKWDRLSDQEMWALAA